MHTTKTILALGVLAATAYGARAWVSDEPLLLKEEQVALLYNETEDEAVIFIAAEIENRLQSLRITDPAGRTVLSLETRGDLGFDLSGIKLETGEGTLQATCLAYPRGVYRFRGTTVDGLPVKGSAALTHAMVRPPHLTLPVNDDRSTSVDHVMVRWHADEHARGYQIAVEQNDNDGLTVDLPPGAQEFSVPPGLLIPGVETFIEVSAFGPNGNRSSSEVVFFPQ